MNNIEMLEEFIENYKKLVITNKEVIIDYKYLKEKIQAIENLIKENKELKEKIVKIKDLCNTKPYVAYTLYGDLLYESDEILELLEEGE